jgi:DNA-directed RNA polymerase subunit M/transcription elongation factor TFIIS
MVCAITSSAANPRLLRFKCSKCDAEHPIADGTILVSYGEEESDYINTNRRYLEDMCTSTTAIIIAGPCGSCKNTKMMFFEDKKLVRCHLMCTECHATRAASEDEIRAVLESD